MFHYHIEVNFDDRMESMPESINSLLEKYNGVSIGHDRTGTTTLFLNTEENLTKRKLEGLLETMRILSFKKTKIKDTKQSYSSC